MHTGVSAAIWVVPVSETAARDLPVAAVQEATAAAISETTVQEAAAVRETTVQEAAAV